MPSTSSQPQKIEARFAHSAPGLLISTIRSLYVNQDYSSFMQQV